jgi:hypothetical protein
MKKKSNKKEICCCSKTYNSNNCAIYGLGFVGSAVYYVSTATGFWMGVLGVLKSIVWPAFVVFEILKFLGA